MRCSRVKQTVHVNEQRDMKLMVSRLTAEKEQYAMELRQLLQQGGACTLWPADSYVGLRLTVRVLIRGFSIPR